MEIVGTPGNPRRVVLPYGVYWAPSFFERFPYRLRQRPGPLNPLGRIKFVFPNRFDVYLHDTPSDRLFASTDRAFSHGCIRVERPLDLAAWLLEDEPGWGRRSLVEAIDTEERRTLRLAQPVPVHILYFTAFVDDEGRLETHQDIYGLDAKLARDLDGAGRARSESLYDDASSAAR
jgi:murein L,D-transpeptidase YcbB/YkuD